MTSLPDDLPRARWRLSEAYPGLLATAVGLWCFGPSLIGLRSFVSVNVLTQAYPWVAIAGDQSAGHEGCTLDTIDAVLPGIAQVRSAGLHGHLAAWQQLVAGGGPLAALPDLGLADPLSWAYWVLPLRLAPAYVALTCFVVAIVGTFGFLRLLGLGRASSTLAGLIYALSGFMVMWTNWPQTRVAALVPALFWAGERLLQRRRLRDLAIFSAVLAAMVLGGFPAVTGWALYLLAAYLGVRLVQLEGRRFAAWVQVGAMFCGGLLLALALAAVQLLPFVAFYRSQDLTYRLGHGLGGLPLVGLVTLFAPSAYGLCTIGTPTYGPLIQVELIAAVGAAAAVLAVIGAVAGVWSGRERRGLWAVMTVAAAVMVAVLYGPTVVRRVTNHLPVFNGNFIGRLSSLLGFALAVLAAVGYEWVLGLRGAEARTPRSSARRWAGALWGLAGLFGLAVVALALRDAAKLGYLHLLLRHLWWPLLLVAAAAAVSVVARWRPEPGRLLAALVLPALVAGQGAAFLHGVLPGDAPANFYPETPTHGYLAAHLGSQRFAASGMTMYPATALYYGLRTPTGHAFYEAEWAQLLQRVDPSVMVSPTSAIFSPRLNPTTVGHQPILDAMGVSAFVAPPGQVVGRTGPFTPAATSVVGGTTCPELPGPLRGVAVVLARPVEAATSAGATIDLEVSGGGRHWSSARFLGRGVAAGPLVVGLAGEQIRGPVVARLWLRGARTPLQLRGRGETPSCAAIAPRADGLRLVSAEAGGVIYQRLDAAPRIRWAPHAVVVRTAAGRLATLARGVPASTVVLSTPGPRPAGRGALIAVTADAGGVIDATVTASGLGYLVVADAMLQPGWSVRVDGQVASLRAADHAMVAVAVPAGLHHVQFTYRAPGLAAGWPISLLALVVVGVAVAFGRRRLGAGTTR